MGSTPEHPFYLQLSISITAQNQTQEGLKHLSIHPNACPPLRGGTLIYGLLSRGRGTSTPIPALAPPCPIPWHVSPCPLIRKLLTFISCIKNFLTKREQVGTSPEPIAPLPSLLEESLCMLIYTYSFTSKVITHVCAASGTGFLPWQKPP